MSIKKKLLLTTLILTFFTLSACSTKNKVTEIKSDTTAQTFKTKNENIRLQFNDIKVSDVSNEFQGGSSLENIKSLYGDPKTSEDIPAGDVTVNSYTWEIDGITINAELFNDSTIGKSISNFNFIRKNTITKKKYESLSNGMSYQKVISILGEPDDFSQASSSDSSEIKALWGTGIKSKNRNSTIRLTFTNGNLVEKSTNAF